ncbi:hypothetical protein HNP37_002044 [Flavobacterium nitrogenifigens]|uniref:Uncharacterized protein n=2 Tax=Flavobacterium TaxID=237 RepID=A0A7W7IWQ1_9FLAO|nr:MULTISPECIES: hypothetical protein [Flavobacterium]MBB4801983.1 hypothetical protein [Flavobacterium nitrogenifigens]MBB6386941.1 hypothetical protein [Flavobacterium notoginsengisoli]
MKKNLLLFLLFTSLSYAQTKKEILVGEWEGTDMHGTKNKMIFTSDNFISMTINGEFIDGKNFIIRGGKNDGKKALLKYEIDESKVPVTLDAIAIAIEKGKEVEKGRILAILDFKSNNEIRINLGLNGTRATEFNEANEDSTILLKRI